MPNRINRIFLLFLVWVAITSPSWAGSIRWITLKDGRKLPVSLTPSLTPSRRWIVFLPGSGSNIREMNEPLRRELNHPEIYNVLTIHKYGSSVPQSKNSVPTDSFHDYSQRARRKADILETLKNVLPDQKAEIILEGFSEGAYLAPEIALQDKRTKILILRSGGVGSWIEEEKFRLIHQHPLNSILKRIELAQILKFPHSRAHYDDATFETWYSYSDPRLGLDQPSQSPLVRLGIPVLLLNGTHDHEVDSEGIAQEIQNIRTERRKQKAPNPELTLIQLKDFGHGLGIGLESPLIRSFVDKYLDRKKSLSATKFQSKRKGLTRAPK